MSKADKVRVLHALEAAEKAVGFLNPCKRSDLYSDEKLSLALVRLLEIIGEAASKTSLPFKEIHSNIPWRNMTELRNRLIHGYFDINLDTVWDTVKTDLPPLILLLKQLLKYIDDNHL